MKSVVRVPVVLALALLAGCASPDSLRARRDAYVTMSARVDAYDPDGLLFDVVTNTREFNPGSVARGPLARVVVTAPGNLAGHKYLIALPPESSGNSPQTGDELRHRGGAVVFDLPVRLVTRGQHEIIELGDLRWPKKGPEPASPGPRSLRPLTRRLLAERNAHAAPDRRLQVRADLRPVGQCPATGEGSGGDRDRAECGEQAHL